MNYGIDYVGYEYELDLSHQRRFNVFIYQIMPDMYKDIQTHDSKMLALNFIKNKMKMFMGMDVCLMPSMDVDIRSIVKKIILKPVANEYFEFNKGKTKLIGE